MSAPKFSAPKYELAEVIHRFKDKLSGKLSAHQQRTLSAIERCRTSALGGHIDACDTCGHLRISYNSCRNRHCPKCQGVNKEMFIIEQEELLLPVAYYHVVFTLPHELNELCLYAPKALYGLLFESAWHTLNTLAKDKRWLGAKTAATMVLHTWSQTLSLHPHVHCIVPNGGLNKKDKWTYPRKSGRDGQGRFLFPVAAMQKLYRGYFMARLKQQIANQQISMPPTFPKGNAYQKWKNNLYQKPWVVYTKKPFSGVEKVVNYLARYSHRVAITNHRIKNVSDKQVTFEYKDYKEGAKKKQMTLQGEEFLRRFCLHILPKGFRKVRKYGLVSNASKGKDIPKARIALGLRLQHHQLSSRKQRKAKALERLFGEDTNRCPCCKKGQMVMIDVVPSERAPPQGAMTLND